MPTDSKSLQDQLAQLKAEFAASSPFANLTLRIPEMSQVEKNAEENVAGRFYQHLLRMIAVFDASLDENHEVGARLVSFGSALTFHIEQLGYMNPSPIVFYGTSEDGNAVQLIQHVSQISVLLISLPKPDPDQPKRRFGFAPPGEVSPPHP